MALNAAWASAVLILCMTGVMAYLNLQTVERVDLLSLQLDKHDQIQRRTLRDYHSTLHALVKGYNIIATDSCYVLATQMKMHERLLGDVPPLQTLAASCLAIHHVSPAERPPGNETLQ